MCFSKYRGSMRIIRSLRHLSPNTHSAPCHILKKAADGSKREKAFFSPRDASVIRGVSAVAASTECIKRDMLCNARAYGPRFCENKIKASSMEASSCSLFSNRSLSSTASANAVEMPNPRLGYIQCAASPRSATRPFDHSFAPFRSYRVVWTTKSASVLAIAAEIKSVVSVNMPRKCERRSFGVSKTTAGSEKRVVPNMSCPVPSRAVASATGPTDPSTLGKSRFPRPTSSREIPLPSHRENRSSFKQPFDAPHPGGGLGDNA
mmetsp:Transcript_14542/g.61293  ORF Transcript_14542/g.61293 Transcript_14542/m.61293 type:complete len:263 (-) Transcript_14542:902-1690(-)